jgi:hypothetical protein
MNFNWDSSSGGGGGTSETSLTIKSKYESNPDTNAFTDSDKTKVDTLPVGGLNNTSLNLALNTLTYTDINGDSKRPKRDDGNYRAFSRRYKDNLY